MGGMSEQGKSAAERLATQVQYLKGVGPRRAEMLERLGMRTVADLLFFFPRDYEDHTDRRQVADLEEGSLQTVRGLVEEVEMRDVAPGRNMLGMLVRVGSGYLRAVWFNQPFLFTQYRRGQEVLVSGKPKQRGLMWQMVHPRVTILGEDEPETESGILPIYPLTEGLQQWHVRRMVRAALEEYAGCLEEAFTEDFLATHDLWPLAQALAEIHFPTNRQSLEKARRRFVYQELFVLQLALAIKRQQQQTLHLWRRRRGSTLAFADCFRSS